MIETHTLGASDRVFAQSQDGKTIASSICGFLFLRKRPYAVILRKFSESVRGDIYTDSRLPARCRALSLATGDVLHSLDTELRNTPFAVAELVDGVKIDEGKECDPRVSQPSIVCEASIEDGPSQQLYVSGLENEIYLQNGSSIKCVAILSAYRQSASCIGPSILGKRAFQDNELLGIVVAVNTDAQLVFVSSLHEVTQDLKNRFRVLFRDEDLDLTPQPKKILEWNHRVRSEEPNRGPAELLAKSLDSVDPNDFGQFLDMLSDLEHDLTDANATVDAKNRARDKGRALAMHFEHFRKMGRELYFEICSNRIVANDAINEMRDEEYKRSYVSLPKFLEKQYPQLLKGSANG